MEVNQEGSHRALYRSAWLVKIFISRSIAKEMFVVGLINDLLRKPTYHDIIGDFLTGINFIKNHTELQENIKNFLMIFIVYIFLTSFKSCGLK